MASSADGTDASSPQAVAARLGNMMQQSLAAAQRFSHVETEIMRAVAESVAEPAGDPVTHLTLEIKAASCKDDFSVAVISQIAEKSWNEFQQAALTCM